MKVKFKFFSLWLLLSVQLSAFAEIIYPVDQIPDVLKSRANAIVREQRWVVEMNAPDNVFLRVKEAVTIMNKSGEEYARLALFYDKNTSIRTIKGAIYNEFGNLLGKINEKSFQDESAISNFSLFEDSRVKHFLPPIQQYPVTVVYEYEMKFKQNLVVPDWIANPNKDISVESASYELICPAATEVRFKEYNYKGTREESTDGKTKHYKWTVSQLRAKKIEPYALPPESYQVRVKTAPVYFTYYKQAGSYRNWKELGKWIYDALIKTQQTLSPETLSQVKAMTDTLSDTRQKVKALYTYLQKKTRYVSVQIGVGGYRPMAAEEVDRLGYGDCKGLVNYMQSLLAAIDIPSYYCVVYGSSVKKNLETDFASMNQGNHVILAVPLPQDTVWLECTNHMAPFGFLGDFTDDRIVLACTPNGGELLRTPKLFATDNVQFRKGKFSLHTNGDIVGSMRTSFEGGQYANHLWLKDMSGTDQRKKMKEVYNVDQIDFNAIHFKAEADTVNRLLEELELQISRYAPINGKRMYLLPNLFNKQSSAPDLQKRISPFHFVRGYQDEDQFVFELPENFEIEIKPKIVKLETAFGYFESSVTEEDKQVRYFRKLVLFEGQFLPEQYQDYAKFIQAVHESDYGKVVLKEKE